MFKHQKSCQTIVNIILRRLRKFRVLPIKIDLLNCITPDIIKPYLDMLQQQLNIIKQPIIAKTQ